MFQKLISMKSVLRAVTAAVVLGGASMGAMACGSEPYLGEVCTFAFNYCPQGFAPADGSWLPISSNQALYTLLGTIYGGDGKTNFALPDLRSRTVIGATVISSTTGLTPGLTLQQIGEASGREVVTLTTHQLPKIQGNIEEATVMVYALTTQTTGGASTPLSPPSGKPNDSNGNNTIGKIGSSFPAFYPYNSLTAVSVPALVTGKVTDPYGGQPVNVGNPRLALNYCIATTGLYPPR